jgi:hypothetical protein
MFEDLNQYTLLGKSIREPGRDYDDEIVNSEYGVPAAEDALKLYYLQSITNSIGKEDFREEYLASVKYVMEYEVEDLRSFTETILEQITLVYDFEFPYKLDFNTKDQINELLKFLAFIEFDNEDFITTTWKYLNPDVNSLQIEKFCEQNADKIVLEIDEQVDSHDFSGMIAIFLRTYIKDKLVEWFCNRSKNLRTSILIKLLGE